MLKIIFISALWALGIAGGQAQHNAYDIEGNWITEQKDAVIKIYQKDGIFYGKLIWIKNQFDKQGNPLVDSKNPNPKLRSRTLLHLILMSNFEFNHQKQEYENGEIYDARSGNTYKAYLWLENKNTLKLRGFIGFSVIGQTTTWTRFSDNTN